MNFTPALFEFLGEFAETCGGSIWVLEGMGDLEGRGGRAGGSSPLVALLASELQNARIGKSSINKKRHIIFLQSQWDERIF